eukprot:scaffold367_cov202-Alexandrium_tamarense.AAC.30
MARPTRQAALAATLLVTCTMTTTMLMCTTASFATASASPQGRRFSLPWSRPTSTNALTPVSSGSSDTSTMDVPPASDPVEAFDSLARGGAAAAAAKKVTKRSIVKGASAVANNNNKGGKHGTVKKQGKKKMVKKRMRESSKKLSGSIHRLPETATSKTTAAKGGGGGDTMPSIFRIPSEEKYDRYAAALAVTEGLRRVRDAEVERRMEEIKSGDNNSNSGSGGGGKAQQIEQAKKRAESAFLLQSTKAVKALGMTVTQFNQIGREVLADNALKERVRSRFVFV